MVAAKDSQAAARVAMAGVEAATDSRAAARAALVEAIETLPGAGVAMLGVGAFLAGAGLALVGIGIGMVGVGEAAERAFGPMEGAQEAMLEAGRPWVATGSTMVDLATKPGSFCRPSAGAIPSR